MYVYVSGTIFQFDFTRAGYYVIQSHHYHYSHTIRVTVVMVASDYIITSTGEIELKNDA